MSLSLGIAVADITPPLGLPMGGYAARADPAQGVLDSLQGRVAVWRQGARAVVLVALDVLYIRATWAAALRRNIARRLRIEPAAVMIAATHTHAGPAVFRSAMRETAALAAYERGLADTILSAASDAAAAARPVDLRFGAAGVDGVAANRQDESRRVDTQVRVLVAQQQGERLAGIVAVFACHPTVLPASNVAYSRDLFGAAVEQVERELGVPVLLFNGAAADVSTRFTRRAQTVDEVARLGGLLAQGIVAAVAASRRIGGEALDATLAEAPIEPRPLPSIEEAQRQMSAAVERVEAARHHVSGAELRRLAAHVEGAVAQLYFTQQGGVEALFGPVPEAAPLQLIRIGDCDLLAVPGEMFSAAGASIAGRRSRPTLLVGYANDYLGYLVPPDADWGYESLMAFVTPASAVAIADTLAGLGSEAIA